MKKLFVFVLFVFCMSGVVYMVMPCAAMDTAVLAEVNGEAINKDALQKRIKAIHRNKPQMRPEGGAGGIKILDIVEEMIDERLIIQDAYRVELDRSADFTKKIESFMTTQSIIRLRKEVVLDKINISDQDILDYFKEHYEKDGPTPEGMFEKVVTQIKKKLWKEKEKVLSDNFISEIRKQADIWIDSDLINLLDAEKNYTEKKSVVATVSGDIIPLNDFLHDMKQATQKRARMYLMIENRQQLEEMQNDLKEEILDSLITYKLIEQEALKRNYAKDPLFMNIVKKRKDQLLINEFKAKTIYPLTIPTKNELTQYYEDHIDDFKKGYEVWYKEMIFLASEDAEKALKELKQGASFEFLAAQVSEKWIPRQRTVWVNADSFSPAIRKELNRLEAGEITEVIADNKQYKIIKLKGKRGGEPIEFSGVVDRLKKIVGQKNFDKMLSKYLTELRDVSKIKINKKALKLIQKKYRQKLSEETKTQVSP
ncbi:MAG: peptidyl-prolyl cis-trans isomerase [Deltaproteobacteria bacterium]|nr:peptidyl-prolyl cis-trans isomerase [Deltaproteobacteria bacterium]